MKIRGTGYITRIIQCVIIPLSTQIRSALLEKLKPANIIHRRSEIITKKNKVFTIPLPHQLNNNLNYWYVAER